MRILRSPILALAALATIGLAACVPSNVPTSYDDTTESSFVGACTADIPLVAGSTITTLASSGYCQCAYQVFVDNVPYNDQDKKDRGNGQTFAGYDGPTYLELDKKLHDDANALPQNIVDKLKQCPSENVTAGTTPGTTPGSVPVGESSSGTTPGGAAGTVAVTTP